MSGSHEAGYYVYKGKAPLGCEPLGTDYRTIWRDLKTHDEARRRAKRLFKNDYSIFHFHNFFDDRTFTKIGTW